MATMHFEIRAVGPLDDAVTPELEGLRVLRDGATVVLSGPVVDQAALLGLLARLRRSGLRVVDVMPVATGSASEAAR